MVRPLTHTVGQERVLMTGGFGSDRAHVTTGCDVQSLCMTTRGRAPRLLRSGCSRSRPTSGIAVSVAYSSAGAKGRWRLE